MSNLLTYLFKICLRAQRAKVFEDLPARERPVRRSECKTRYRTTFSLRHAGHVLFKRTVCVSRSVTVHVRLYSTPIRSMIRSAQRTRQLHSTLNSPTLSSLVPRLFLVVLRSSLSPPCGRVVEHERRLDHVHERAHLHLHVARDERHIVNRDLPCQNLPLLKRKSL